MAYQQQNPHAKDVIEYICSVKGNFQLCINGFPFTRHDVRDNTIYWRCVQARPLGCRARARTKQDGKHVEIVDIGHNHQLISQRRKKGHLKAMMARKKLQK